MPPWSAVAKRLLFSVLVFYLVVSATFAFVAFTPDPNLGQVAWGVSTSPEYQQADQAEREQMVEAALGTYREARNLDDPLPIRYANWLVDVTTLDFGFSYSQRAPVTDVLANTIPATLAYVIPASLLALVGGIGLGVYSAFRSGSPLERLTTGGVYVGFGFPNYWLVIVIPVVLGVYAGGFHRDIPRFTTVILPALVLGGSLLAGQLRYARAESREYINTEFVKLLRAKGASEFRVASHVLKNAALPLLSLFFVDLLGVLVVNVFILESVLPIQGLGSVGLTAIHDRDMPLILGIAVVLAFVGVVGNLIQDLAYLLIDPRIDAGDGE